MMKGEYPSFSYSIRFSVNTQWSSALAIWRGYFSFDDYTDARRYTTAPVTKLDRKEVIKIKRIIGACLAIVVLTLSLGTPAIAAPNDNASHVALCATSMGGTHIAQCAQTMDRGVSMCATMEQCPHN